MTKEEMELLHWACPKNCPDRKVHRIDEQLVSCHYLCKRYLAFQKANEKYKKEQHEERAIERSSYSDCQLKELFRNKTKR